MHGATNGAVRARRATSIVPETPGVEGLPSRVLLESLYADTPAAVALYHVPSFELISLNQAAAAWIGHDVGASDRLWDHLPSALVPDRRRAVAEAIDANEPRRVVGMERGAWTRTVYRPVTTDAGAALLAITCPVGEAAPPVPEDDVPTRRSAVDDFGALERLTEREVEVFRLIGLGMTSDQIGKTLHRSVKTVQGHRNSLGLKLQVENRVGIARLAIAAGITRLSGEQVTDAWRRAHRKAATPSQDQRPEIGIRSTTTGR
jgi:DNA-binding CsgD family transcriptional regulator